ncbi:MAG: biotin--[acetyl-CoA-carboxylase] ligase [Magnetococcales bacterium]|nr:biotin--[acetyl-CoA-carboxylase] ligase [Magnetococcales bacterium]
MIDVVQGPATAVDATRVTDTPTAAVMAPLLTGSLFRSDRYHFFPVLASTNQQAAQLAQAGAAEGTVVVADQQTQGRGRLGRQWSSPAGVNLYCSVVLRPTLLPRDAAQLTLLAGVALAHTLTEWGVAGVLIKWPNDLLLQGRKAAGILTEMRTDRSGIQHVIVGIGLNVNGQAADLPLELRDRATSLAESLHSAVCRPPLLAKLLAQLDHWYGRFGREGFAPVRQEWLACSRLLGQSVGVRLADEQFSGQAVALDADGCLLVQRADGMLARVVAGDVTLLGKE